MLLYLMPFSASVVVKEAERHDDDADAVYDASGTPDKSSLVSVTGSSTESSSSSSDDDSGIEFVSNSYIFIIFFYSPVPKGSNITQNRMKYNSSCGLQTLQRPKICYLQFSRKTSNLIAKPNIS